MHDDHIAVGPASSRGGCSPEVISVIVPTVCATERSASLRRAVASALSQVDREEGLVQVILVANGLRVDPELLEEMASTPSVRVVRRPEGNVTAARLAGRRLVLTPYFSFLDDDDELLPGAVEAALTRLTEDPRIDIVVSNGYLRHNGLDTLVVSNMAQVSADPIGTFLHRNWFLSGAATFRTTTVPESVFDVPTKYFEWTLIGFMLLASGVHFAFIDTPAYRVNDSTESASKSDEYHDAEVGMLQSLVRQATAGRVRRRLRQKLAIACHTQSDRALNAGAILDAWRWHLRSLTCLYGLKHLAYTRHLLRNSCRGRN